MFARFRRDIPSFLQCCRIYYCMSCHFFNDWFVLISELFFFLFLIIDIIVIIILSMTELSTYISIATFCYLSHIKEAKYTNPISFFLVWFNFKLLFIIIANLTVCRNRVIIMDTSQLIV